MAEVASAAGTPRASRLDRRRARTRQALIGAAARLIAEGRGERASIQEITEEADIGFGSFYNHFDNKEQLFAVRLRISGWLGWNHPDMAGFLVGGGLEVLDVPTVWRPGLCGTSGRPQAVSGFPMPRSR